MTALVSVLMTSYNREKYIAEAIESVLQSVYDNFELIIVDDGSSDRTVSIAKEYEVKDKRVKVFVNEKNLGDYPNRNLAASYASGKYIKYLDSDDLIYPHGLQVMVDAMEKFPLAAFAFSGREVQDDSSPYPVLYSSEEAFRTHFLGGGLLFAGPSGTIIKTNAFRMYGGFSGKRFISDTELFLKMAMKSPIVKVQPSLIWWRKHEGQEFHEGVVNVHYISLRWNMNQEILGNSDCPLPEHERKMILGNLKRLLGRRLYKRVFLKFGLQKLRETMRACHVGPEVLFEAFLPVNRIKRMFRSIRFSGN